MSQISSHLHQAAKLLSELTEWLAGLRQSPPDDFPVPIIVTDRNETQVKDWRLQRMRDALGIVAALRNQK